MGFLIHFYYYVKKVYDTCSDQSIPVALSLLMGALTRNFPKPDPNVARRLVPFALMYSKKYEGDTVMETLRVLVNVSEFGREIIIEMLNSGLVMEHLIKIMQMRYTEFQLLTCQFLENCCKTYMDSLKYMSEIFNVILETIIQSSNSVFPKMCSFMFYALSSEVNRNETISMFINHPKTIAYLISLFSHQFVDTAHAAVELVCALCLWGKENQHLITLLLDKGIISHICLVLDRTSLTSSEGLLSLLLDNLNIIFFHQVHFKLDTDVNAIYSFTECHGNMILDQLLVQYPGSLEKVKILQGYLTHMEEDNL
ncbi:Importin alpha [Entamoeba marina]